jgi:hypothetical protein
MAEEIIYPSRRCDDKDGEETHGKGPSLLNEQISS